ncbi:MAG: HlyD family efflux transporter periplasmic adaptor subunit [Leptospirales bacterium]|nr:HlyD family efflux transporter periplasmic adaptor subunit [Leptospirales bacterium]
MELIVRAWTIVAPFAGEAIALLAPVEQKPSTYRVERKTLKPYVVGSGILEASREQILLSPRSGYVVLLPFKPGQYVRRGQAVAVLNETVSEDAIHAQEQRVAGLRERLDALRDEYGRAVERATLESAGSRSDRADFAVIDSELADREISPALLATMVLRARMGAAVRELDEAYSELARLEKEKAASAIRAEISGVLVSLEVHPGSSIGDEGLPIGRIVDSRQLEAVVDLPAASYSKLHQGMLAQVSTEGARGTSEPGHLVSPGFCPDPQHCEIRVSFRNPGYLLPGMSAKVRFDTGAEISATVVPVEAVSQLNESSGETAVLTRRGIRRREVELGDELVPGFLEIRSGLDAGEEILEKFDGPD